MILNDFGDTSNAFENPRCRLRVIEVSERRVDLASVPTGSSSRESIIVSNVSKAVRPRKESRKKRGQARSS